MIQNNKHIIKKRTFEAKSSFNGFLNGLSNIDIYLKDVKFNYKENFNNIFKLISLSNSY